MSVCIALGHDAVYHFLAENETKKNSAKISPRKIGQGTQGRYYNPDPGHDNDLSQAIIITLPVAQVIQFILIILAPIFSFTPQKGKQDMERKGSKTWQEVTQPVTRPSRPANEAIGGPWTSAGPAILPDTPASCVQHRNLPKVPALTLLQTSAGTDICKQCLLGAAAIFIHH